jgi:hypothetical protein
MAFMLLYILHFAGNAMQPQPGLVAWFVEEMGFFRRVAVLAMCIRASSRAMSRISLLHTHRSILGSGRWPAEAVVLCSKSDVPLGWRQGGFEPMISRREGFDGSGSSE